MRQLHAQCNDLTLLGAYGLAFRGSGRNTRLLPADPAWPEWEIRWRRQESPHGGAPSRAVRREEWSPDHARLNAKPNGTILLDRIARTTTFVLPEPPSPEALAHPFLASTGVVAGHWLGRTPLHAGAFVLEGRVWGLLGARKMGKTSTLMGLHLAGVPVLTDDVLVVESDTATAFSGPRCIDLRKDAAERFSEGRPIGVVGTRERWRVELPSLAGQLPLSGWVLLDWSETTSVEKASASVRLSGLAAHRGLIAQGTPEDGLLDLVTLPMVVFSRVRSWGKFDEGIARLQDALADV
jgi:hypothetical protein